MNALFQLFKRAFQHEEPLHPVDQQLAKKWIKQRLVIVFPELRDNARALEQAYRSLGLEPRAGQGEGENETVFEMQMPRDLDEP